MLQRSGLAVMSSDEGRSTGLAVQLKLNRKVCSFWFGALQVERASGRKTGAYSVLLQDFLRLHGIGARASNMC